MGQAALSVRCIEGTRLWLGFIGVVVMMCVVRPDVAQPTPGPVDQPIVMMSTRCMVIMRVLVVLVLAVLVMLVLMRGDGHQECAAMWRMNEAAAGAVAVSMIVVELVEQRQQEATQEPGRQRHTCHRRRADAPQDAFASRGLWYVVAFGRQGDGSVCSCSLRRMVRHLCERNNVLLS